MITNPANPVPCSIEGDERPGELPRCDCGDRRDDEYRPDDLWVKDDVLGRRREDDEVPDRGRERDRAGRKQWPGVVVDEPAVGQRVRADHAAERHSEHGDVNERADDERAPRKRDERLSADAERRDPGVLDGP